MKNPRDEVPKTVEPKVRLGKSWRVLLALALVAAFASLPATGSTLVALADKGGTDGHTFTATFTKWVISTTTAGGPLKMIGNVGGDVGTGLFVGEVLKYTPGDTTNGNITKIEALYHFNGRRHSFTAHVYVTENDNVGTAVITGRITEGWLEDAQVTGAYTVWASCPIVTPRNVYGTLCFQGTLHIQPGDEP